MPITEDRAPVNGSETEFSLFTIMTILFRWRKLLLWFTLGGIIIGIAVAFLLPNWYFSYATVKSAAVQRQGLNSLLGGGGLDQLMGGFSDLGLSSGPSDLHLFESIIHSRRVLGKTVQQFDLMNLYGSRYFVDAIDELKSNTESKVDIEGGTLTLGVYDKSPQRAQQIAAFMLQELNTVNIELNTIRGHNTREFIESRYNEAMTQLHQAEDSLKAFQQSNGVYLLDEQAKRALEAAAELNGQLTAREVQLRILRDRLNEDQPEVLRLQEETNALRSKLREFYYGGDIARAGKNDPRMFVPFSTAPEVGQRYLRLLRTVKINEKISETLIPLLEKAKIDEKQDTPTLLVIDSPFVPEKKSRPIRFLIVAAFLFGGFFSSLLYILGAERLRVLKAHKPERYAQLNQFASDVKHSAASVLHRTGRSPK